MEVHHQIVLILLITSIAYFRVQESSLNDMDNKYKQLLERAVMLEGELESKATVEEEIQRLRDELRGKIFLMVPLVVKRERRGGFFFFFCYISFVFTLDFLKSFL